MQGDVIHLIEALHQHLAVPFGIVLQHGGGAANTGQLQVLVKSVHQLTGDVCQSAVFLGLLVTHLPLAVQLVAKTPQLNVEGLFCAVLPPPFGELRATRRVAVFQHVRRLQCAASAEVHGHHGLCAQLLDPVEEVMQTEFVRFHLAPREVQRMSAVGADGVLPAIGAGVVAAGVADEAKVERLEQLQNVHAPALFIGAGVTGLEDAVIDHRAHVLHK